MSRLLKMQVFFLLDIQVFWHMIINFSLNGTAMTITVTSQSGKPVKRRICTLNTVEPRDEI